MTIGNVFVPFEPPVEDAVPRFARFSEGGRVHVLRDTHQPFGYGTGIPLETFGPMAWIMAKLWALCGKTGSVGLPEYVSHFNDEDLCHKCLKLWPHDSVLLFNHPQDRPEEDE